MNPNKPSRSWRGDKPTSGRKALEKDKEFKKEPSIARDNKKRFTRLTDYRALQPEYWQ